MFVHKALRARFGTGAFILMYLLATLLPAHTVSAANELGCGEASVQSAVLAAGAVPAADQQVQNPKGDSR